MVELSQSNPDSLEHPVNKSTILELYDEGLLTLEARRAAIEAAQPTQHWWQWVNRSLLFIGAALMLAGVVFFFAYNWSRMHAVAKFSVIEAGLWLCAIGSMQRGLDRLTGKVLLLAASVLVGVLLAVYGQVYQTGADDWKIYALWGLLLLPWAIVGRFNALWILWLVVTNVAWLLFWFQMEPPAGFTFELGIFSLLGCWNGLAIAIRERAMRRGVKWIGGRWARHLIWFAVLVYLVIPTIALIVDPEFGSDSLVGAVGLLIALGVSHVYFRDSQPDLLCLGFNVLAGCIVLLTLIGKVLFEASDEAGVFLMFGLAVLGVSGAAAFYLRNLSRKMDDGQR